MILGAAGAFSTGGMGKTFISYLSNQKEHVSGILLTLIIGLILSVYISFKKLCVLLKEQSGEKVIRVLDIVLGYHEFIKQYYENRLNDTKDIVESEKIKQKNKELEQKEEYLIEFERRMLDQKKGLLFFKLPEQSEIPVTNSFIRKMPMYVDNICKFKSDVDRLTKEFCEKFSQDKEDNKELLKAYFVGIGMYVSNDLFGSSGTNIRTHFRILRNGQHVKYTAVLGSIISNDKITEIPQNSNSMIDRSFQLKKSLIASLNPEYNYDTKTKWDDYMTITYYNLKSCDEPFLSMAISIKYVEQYGDMLYFLNFYKIEECMDSYIKMIDRKCDIVNTLK